MFVTLYDKVIYDERHERSRTVDLFCIARRSTNQTSCITSRDQLLAEKATRRRDQLLAEKATRQLLAEKQNTVYSSIL